MPSRTLISALATALLTAGHAQQPAMPPAPHVPGLPAAALTAMQAISPARLAAHTKFLSDDLLEGRGPGTRGGRLAARYMESQFALLGLTPAGDPGPDGRPTFSQRLPMVNVSTLPESTFSFSASGQTTTLTGGTDYTATNQTATPTVDIASAPIVFVGYGIHAPELGWDDYADTDLHGKVALILVNQPPAPGFKDPAAPATPFTGKALTYFGRWTYKYEEAARQGAVAAILIHQTDMAAYPWSVVGSRWGRKTAYLAQPTNDRVPLAAWIQFDVAARLLAGSHLDLPALLTRARTPGFHALPLASTLSAHLISSLEPFTGENLVARLPAPAASGPALLYTAHFDHLGISPTQPSEPAATDHIFNGAIDNATGDAMLLEVARAFTLAPPPSHPVFFAAVDAEEQGLLGSEYLAEHPPVPARDLALNLNFEGIFIMPAGIPEQLLVTGAETTPYLRQVAEVAQAFAMQIVPDPLPSAGYFFRSDHFSFSRAGIPAFSIGSGNKFAGHDLAYGQTIAADYIAHRYHQPADEWNPAFDLRANARLAQLSIALGWQAMLHPAPNDSRAPAQPAGR